MTDLGVISLICHNRACNAPKLQEVITTHGDMILGRMGMPSPDKEAGVICLIVSAPEARVQSAANDMSSVQGVTASYTMLHDE